MSDKPGIKGLPRAIFDACLDGIFVIDLDGRYVDVNPAGCRMFGYSREELLTNHVTLLIHPEDREEALARDRKGWEEGMTIPSYRLRHKDGSEVWVSMTISPLILDGSPLVLGIKREIGDVIRAEKALRQAEEALRISEDKYRTVVENAGEIITVIQDGIIQFVNSRGAEFTGMAVDDIVGRPISDMIAEEDREMVHGQHRKRLAGEIIPAYSYRVKDSNGNLKWIEMRGALVEWNGRPATVNYLADISERKRLEEQLRHSQRMEAVGRLAGGIAHDFNNLLTAITGYGSLLETQLEESDPRRREVEEILRASDRATELTDQLLVFSRRKVSEPKVVDLNLLVVGMESMLRRLLGEKVALETVFDPALEAVKVDPVQMEQVLMNLVVNAHEAIPEGGRIIVRTDNIEFDDEQCRHRPEARPGRFTRLAVEDNGTGLEPEVIEHIFEPFFSTRDHGTGLGLSLVYGIVTQHEGWVEVNSVPGVETTFAIFLPRVSGAPERRPTERKKLNGLQGRGERILLVEDEDGVRRYATRVLSENGYTIFPAASAGEALKVFSEEAGRFHLVFSDQVLPGRSGLELVEELRTLKPAIRVLLTSGYAGKESSRKQIEDKGYPFLKKPYGTSDILARIREVLDGDR